MKKILFTFGLLAIISACHKEENNGQEQLLVSAANMAGTWVWYNGETGASEIMKFTENGDFFYTNSLENASFVDEVTGDYSIISSIASVSAIHKGNKFNFNVTSLTANSMTIKHKTLGSEVTYARLLTQMEISYDVSIKPDYGLYLAGNIKGFRSHNDKTASVDKTGVITGKSEGITLIDVDTSEGTAVVIVKVGGLIYDYTQAIGLTKGDVCDRYGVPTYVTDETVFYSTDEKMTTYNINKRTKVVDAIYIIYSKKGFSNTALVDYLSNKYYAYKAETVGTFYAFTNSSTYESSNVKITFDGAKHLTYSYVNHDLFEDFSIALGKSRDEVVYMYGDELECIIDRTSYVEYAIGNEVQGYPGADIMEEVKFSFDGGVATMVELRLYNQLKQEVVMDFLKGHYSSSIENSNSRHLYYYDKTRRLVVDYEPQVYTIRYYFEE